MRALDNGLISNLDELYFVGLSLLIKDEKYFDLYDKDFLSFFNNPNGNNQLVEIIKKEIKEISSMFNTLDLLISADQEPKKKQISAIYDFNSIRELQQILGKNEQRDIKDRKEKNSIGFDPNSQDGQGIGGTQGGFINAAGGGSNTAIKVAGKRFFSQYSKDAVINTRQIQIILRKLKNLEREGYKEEELDIEGSIAETIKNLGEIEIKMIPKRKNRTILNR